MKESAEQPLLEVPAEDAPKKTAKRRTATTTRSRAKKPTIKAEAEKTGAPGAAPESTPKAAVKSTTTRKKSSTKKKSAEPDEPTLDLPTNESTSAAKAPEASAPLATTSEAAKSAPQPTLPTTAAPAHEAPPPAATPGGRRYPVYIPRTVAKQLEAEGKLVGVAVNSAEELPKEVLEQIAAAATPPQSHRRERHPRPDRSAQAPTVDPMPAGSTGGTESLPPELIGAPAILEGEPKPEELAEGEGIIEISGKGFGFLRDAKRNFAQTPNDIFVTPEIVKHFHLRDGQMIRGIVRRGPRGAQLHKLLTINGDPGEDVRNLPAFDELTVISPEPRITLETTPDRFTTRIVDLMCPIGRGQRALVVAPPRTGKTTFLLHMAEAVKKNHPDIHLMFLLIDERPEEVTDIKRSVPGAEVFASSNDLDVKSHTRIAQLAIERARRLVEQGKHVFILLDSITRVGRAFNNAMTGGGRTGSGGLDSRALETPRRLFASARNTEEAGSLTIVGTTLVETNSRADEVIFQEFKGTGNMELVLDRKIAEQRVYPAIDIFMSGTRREELLIPPDDLHKIHIIRRGLAGYKPLEAVERLLFFMKKFPTNAQMLAGIPG
jgi:transcription termination factor Rho